MFDNEKNLELEVKRRVQFIKDVLKESGAKGIIFGNSGGKDSALVAILCKMACDNVLGVAMPCGSKRNYNEDLEDAKRLADKFNIKTIVVDLTEVKETLIKSIEKEQSLIDQAKNNIPPRLRMTTLYSIAQTLGYIVAGTGNRSEAFMGYFTKWGDGAYDFNPIADLTVTEVYEYLRFLNAPEEIINKAPSAGLFDGQTDEGEMGITYKAIDDYILKGRGTPENIKKLQNIHKKTQHKREMPKTYKKLGG